MNSLAQTFSFENFIANFCLITVYLVASILYLLCLVKTMWKKQKMRITRNECTKMFFSEWVLWNFIIDAHVTGVTWANVTKIYVGLTVSLLSYM